MTTIERFFTEQGSSHTLIGKVWKKSELVFNIIFRITIKNQTLSIQSTNATMISTGVYPVISRKEFLENFDQACL